MICCVIQLILLTKPNKKKMENERDFTHYRMLQMKSDMQQHKAQFSNNSQTKNNRTEKL